MWCKVCNLETTEKICPTCGALTEKDIDREVFWCEHCKIPIIVEKKEFDHKDCPICGDTIKYLSKDLRPVFPEERLLVELLLGIRPYEWMTKSVWAENNRYFVDGKVISIASRVYRDRNAEVIGNILRQYLSADNRSIRGFNNKNAYTSFQKYMDLFVQANQERLNYIKDEAVRFIRSAAQRFDEEQIVLSFSGGKDSTVTADIVTKALGNPSLVHIFGDTTLEFPSTISYAKRYRAHHQDAIFKVARNNDQQFMDVASDIGPPARMMRWCCFMFKTGPITRILNRFYRNKKVLTFYGIRKVESVSRSKYRRMEDTSSHIKIQKQVVASPIFFWKDLDIWLYLLSERVDFNDAYRLGYDRVGCWLCPNNNIRAQFLSKIYMPEQAKQWRDFLVNFAKKIGKPDAEEYVDSGMWKARQGGNGLRAAEDVKIKFTNCTSEEHAKIYSLVRPFTDEFLNMMVPFGILAPELGRKLIHETLVLDSRTKVPILSIQPFNQNGFEYAVKIQTLNVESHEDLQAKVAYQVRKYNACRKCLKCESVCQAGAISVRNDGYYINSDRCVHCLRCVTAKYIRGGCMMEKYLLTKQE